MAAQTGAALRYEPVEEESSFARDVIAGLAARPKRLPPKYFYDEVGAKLFEQITALLGGHLEGGAFSLGALSSHVKNGAVRGMVVSNAFPGFPDIPTLSQLGYRQNLLGVWLAFFAPAGVPAEATKTLVGAIEKVAKDPAVAAKLVGFGILQDYVPPEKVAAEIREEHRIVEELAKKAGLVK